MGSGPHVAERVWRRAGEQVGEGGKMAEDGSPEVLELQIPSLYPQLSHTHILVLRAQNLVF